MIVVADTSPINYLLLLQRVDLLRLLYGRVIVPEAVMTELRHPKAPRVARDWVATPPRWLDVRSVTVFDQSLLSRLGPGEREAISLALELRADTLLVDELDGREQAENRRLKVAGTLAVLVRSALEGRVDLPIELGKLRSLGFRMSSALEGDTIALYRRLQKRSLP